MLFKTFHQRFHSFHLATTLVCLGKARSEAAARLGATAGAQPPQLLDREAQVVLVPRPRTDEHEIIKEFEIIS